MAALTPPRLTAPAIALTIALWPQAPYLDTEQHLPFPPLRLRFALICAQMMIYHERFQPTASQLALYRAAIARCESCFNPTYLRKVVAEFVCAARACHDAPELLRSTGSDGSGKVAVTARSADDQEGPSIAAADATAHVATSKLGHARAQHTKEPANGGTKLPAERQHAAHVGSASEKQHGASASESDSLMDAVRRSAGLAWLSMLMWRRELSRGRCPVLWHAKHWAPSAAFNCPSSLHVLVLPVFACSTPLRTSHLRLCSTAGHHSWHFETQHEVMHLV